MNNKETRAFCICAAIFFLITACVIGLIIAPDITVLLIFFFVVFLFLCRLYHSLLRDFNDEE